MEREFKTMALSTPERLVEMKPLDLCETDHIPVLEHTLLDMQLGKISMAEEEINLKSVGSLRLSIL